MNWKLRFKNRVTLLAIIAAAVTLVYQILGIVGVTAPISKDVTMQLVGGIINLLVLLGIVVDPTTQGVGDSELAQSYDSPAENTKVY